MASPTGCCDLGVKTLDSFYMKYLTSCGKARSNLQHGKDLCSSQSSTGKGGGKDQAVPTYVAFLDYSTAFPSVFRVKLLSLLQRFNIVGKMWKHLRARFHTVEVRVLHPQIPPSWWVKILRGLPEGSRLSPSLFRILVADLIQQLQIRFPSANIISNNTGQIGQTSPGVETSFPTALFMQGTHCGT
jgi:hypothetical protein